MRGKVAKELRRAAKNIPDIPNVEYKETTKDKVTFNHMTNMVVPYQVTQRKLVNHCTRAWYKAIKKAYKIRMRGGHIDHGEA